MERPLSTREQARKDLREYDNPKSGNNKNFQNNSYLLTVELKYGMTEKELRAWANEKVHRR